MGRCIFVVGATGTGKSQVAYDLARAKGAAVLAMDAMQVYRGADIGTSKPTRAEQEALPHGGLDLVELGEAFDVARYRAYAAEFLAAHRNRLVIVVGGTGLYFRALTRGLCEAPPGTPELRKELRELSTAALRDRLTRIDPAIMAQLDASNPRRLSRAIEVMETTGRSLLAWQNETAPPLVTDYTAFWLQREKAELLVRLEARLRKMLEEGWVDEVCGLIARHGEARVAAFPGIGYRELAEVVAGCRTLAAAQRDILVATRQYAKRQLTWFAAEPKLQAVTLSGTMALPPALLS